MTGKPDTKRALAKTAIIALVIAAAILVAVTSVDEQALTHLKHTLSLWTIIALVVIVNLVSAAVLLLLYAAYRWVRSDLPSPPEEDEF